MEEEQQDQTYPQTTTNSVNRHKERAIYDASSIHSIVNSTPVVHVSFLPDPTDPLPIILPMIGQMGLYAGDDTWHCYLHGYVTSRLMKFGMDGTTAGTGLPICIAATQVDGLVLSLTPFSHSYNYRSAVLQGIATIVSDPDERTWAMQLITNSVVPGRWENTRLPPDNAELQSTRIMKAKITTASAKVRQGVPSDERKDMKREDVLDSVWTGVIPVWQQLGEPRPGPYNRVGNVPEHITTTVETSNEVNERYAVEAATKPPPDKRRKKIED